MVVCTQPFPYLSCIEVVSDKPSTQVKHNKNQYGKENIVVRQPCWNIMEMRTVAITQYDIGAEKTISNNRIEGKNSIWVIIVKLMRKIDKVWLPLNLLPQLLTSISLYPGHDVMSLVTKWSEKITQAGLVQITWQDSSKSWKSNTSVAKDPLFQHKLWIHLNFVTGTHSLFPP